MRHVEAEGNGGARFQNKREASAIDKGNFKNRGVIRPASCVQVVTAKHGIWSA